MYCGNTLNFDLGLEINLATAWGDQLMNNKSVLSQMFWDQLVDDLVITSLTNN